MKKILVSVLAVILAVFMLATVSGAQQEKEVKVLCIGNSILAHPAAAHLGWYWDWGMAASSADKDYYHVMQQLISEEFPDYKVTFDKAGGNYIEMNVDISTDKDYTAVFEECIGQKMRTLMPDFVVLQIGDNISSMTDESYTNTLVQFVEYCRSINPDTTVILSSAFYGKGATSVKNAAMQTKTPHTHLNKHNLIENLAGSAFEHSGVAGHPGDKGMEAIAKDFYGEIRRVLLAKEGKAEVSVKVDSKYIEFDEIKPTIIDGFTLVPLRAIFEALGADVQWDDATKTVTSTKGDITVKLTIGSNVLKKNDEEIKLDVEARIIDGFTMVPVRAISEAYDCTVNWIDKSKCVDIYSPKEVIVSNIKEIEGALITLADAENKTGGYPITFSPQVEYIKNPEDENDTVFFIETNKADRASWSYFWCEATGKFKPGQRYLVSFDVMHTAMADGTVPTGKSSGGINFAYAEVGSSPADHASTPGGKSSIFYLMPGEWKHIDYIFTMPENLDNTKSSKFGIYANPYDGKLGMSFCLDDVSVVPYEGELSDGIIENMAFAKKVAAFDLDSFKGERLDLSKAKANKGEGKYSDNVFTITAGEDQSDPQFTFSGLELDAEKYGMVVVRTKRENMARQSHFQVFFTTDTQKNLDEKKSINLPFSNFVETEDGYFLGFYDFASHEMWEGTITSLRFDPANSPGVYSFTDIIVLEN